LPEVAGAPEKYSVEIARIGSFEKIKEIMERRTTSVRLGVEIDGEILERGGYWTA
jgi:hypothetical protein